MTEIGGLLQFTRGKIGTLTFTPNEKKAPTASLKLTAELTPELADQMHCRDAVFRADGKPHVGLTRHDLDGILRDVDLSLPTSTDEIAFNWYRPEDIASFKVDVDKMIVRVSMLVRIKSHYQTLTDFMERFNASEFSFAVRGLQSEFDWSGTVGGTRAAVEAGTAEVNGELFHSADAATCLLCQRDIPKNEDGRHLTPDGLVFCELDERSGRVEVGPALPDVREMGARREKRKKLREQHAEEVAEVAP